ncbi:TIGR02221 family CRISPR-associated protein [Thermanaerothrix daxensis]|uniref:TIGR02221 family CRISPR-associated protein n=1 Tax=Thermanaerothrix daxensis TaxID=869279 RepID=UPI0006C8EC06|nr:TIGR02221 family CRISPR-associated protein [Thermanaerothrix daxensis]
MGHTVITFLGVNPQEVDYEYQGKTYTGKVFAEALVQCLKFDRMLVLTTPEAKEKTFPLLQKYGDSRIQEVPIPTGKTEAEMWEIFDAVIRHVPESEEVTFDITHGLRSIPFLVFLFAAYLQSAKQVQIRAILYGALEIGVISEETKRKRAPVVDLSSFATMLRWINAADQFVQTGNASRLANLLKQRKAAETLEQISEAAFLCQPITLMEKAAELRPNLEAAAQSFKITSQPFSVLSERILETFEAFGLKNPLNNYGEFLEREWQLICWYHDHGQLIQALTLTREFLIDVVNYRLEQRIDLEKDKRQTMERALSGLSQLRIARHKAGKKEAQAHSDPEEASTNRVSSPDDLNRYGRRIYDEWPEEWENIAELYDEISQVRNQLNHAQHQVESMKLQKIKPKAEKIIKGLQTLLENWRLISFPSEASSACVSTPSSVNSPSPT